MSSGLAFDLSIDPNPRFVTTVRRFVEEAFDRLSCEPDAVFRVAMTAHELLENAAKYSLTGRALLRFTTRLEGDQAIVNLSLFNETTPAHIERLRGRIAAICGATDPNAHYHKVMRESSRQSSDESGLGLARIAAEAEMMLGLEVNGTTVAIFASTRACTRAGTGFPREGRT
jgi:two-component sensor histidine kinase